MRETIVQKCKAAGIAYQTYYLRVKNGMTPEEALSTPLKRRAMPSAPAQETEDQEPRAPMAYKKYYVFESDFQKNHRETGAKISQRMKEKAQASTDIIPFERPKETPPALKTQIQEIRRPYYGPAKVQNPLTDAEKVRFNNACGGYTAVILNHIKDGEFKYQIYSTKSGNKLYTNDVVRFINGIIKICAPEGKTPFRVIAR